MSIRCKGRPVRACLHAVLLAFALLGLGGPAAAAASLKSPWDAHVAQRPGQARTCPAAPRIPADLSAQKYYTPDGATVDKARKQAYRNDTENQRKTADQIVARADAYRASGEPDDARCVARLLLALADDQALAGTMTGNQANVFRAWMLNAYATSWLKIRQDSGLSSAEQERVRRWLDALAQGTIAFHRTYKPQMKAQNLRYWAGLAVMNAGVALDRRDLYDWGLGWGRNGANAVQPDGTLKEELRRKGRARKYHLFALEPLVAMAEIAADNGDDLYSLNHRGIQRLAHTALDSLSHPDLIARLARAAQEPQSVQGTNLQWLVPLSRRFPDAYYDGFLRKYPARPDTYLGGRLTDAGH